MVMRETNNLRVNSFEPLVLPIELREKYPVTEVMSEFIYESREIIKGIIKGDDSRLMVIVGPCSIHDPEAALEYAQWLADFQKKVSDQLFLVMRVYFEKPRTTIGWKGLINDPDLNKTYNIQKGLQVARKLFHNITLLGVPIASEVLDPVTPQFLSDLVSWGAIGARTTESQTHREVASGLSFPVGFKNGTDGGLQVAIDAMGTAINPHYFPGIDRFGRASIVSTQGNPDVHLVLRGGNIKPNYSRDSIRRAKKQLIDAGFFPSVMVDCSHANSNKNHRLQKNVLEDVVSQILEGESIIRSIMIESNINEGNQKIPENILDLEYGVSITDKCVSIKDTELMLLKAHEDLKTKNPGAIFDRAYHQSSWMDM